MARYQSSAARIEPVERTRPQRRHEPRRDFEVVEGQGLDARVREGVSPQFVRRVRMALLAAVLVVAVGIVRVSLCAAAVSTLKATESLEAEVDAAESLESQLKVERSVMYSSSRIDKIATQNYGMVKASESETIDVSDASAAADGSQDAQADGDAVQSSDAAQADAAVA